jgi:gas vesicle protein
MKSNDMVEKILLAALTSAVSGAVIALLFAPEKGADTRKKLSQKGDEYLEGLKKELEEIRTYLNDRAEDSKDEVNSWGEEAKSKGEDLLDQAKKLTNYDEWTKQELYDRAKALDIDSYSTMNKDELINALRNH